jgi:hypothetical protein
MASEVVLEDWQGQEDGKFFLQRRPEGLCGGIDGYGDREWIYYVTRWLCIHWFYFAGSTKQQVRAFHDIAEYFGFEVK